MEMTDRGDGLGKEKTMDRWALLIIRGGFSVSVIPAGEAAAAIVYVDSNATGDGTGADWSNAFTTITAGLGVSATGDGVWVKSGEYLESFIIDRDLHVYGGFPSGGSPGQGERNPLVYETIIRPATESLFVIDLRGESVLDGVTVTGIGSYRSAVYCDSGSPVLRNCTIRNNRAPGIMCVSSSPTIIDCTFHKNWVRFRGKAGSAVDCADATPTLVRCRITENSAIPGASVYARLGSVVTLEDCEISGEYWTGIDVGYESSISATRCVITRNWLGGVSVTSGNFTNCTIAGNRWYGAQIDGGNLTNCILWNSGVEFADGGGDAVSVSHCCVQGGWPGESNFEAIPRFVDYLGGEFRLLDGSPCVDGGADVGLPYEGAAPDVGAYESPGEYNASGRTHSPRVIYCDVTRATVGDGRTWQTACASVNEGLVLSSRGDELWVRSGRYHEFLLLEPTVSVYGGFNGTETRRSDRDWQANETVVDATGFSQPAVSILFGCTDARLDGITITGGTGLWDGAGGGIECRSSSLSVANCIVEGNRAPGGGGGAGVFGEESLVDFQNCMIRNNSGGDGGGLFLIEGTARLKNCLLVGNSATDGGGINVFATASGLQLTNCTIAENTALDAGGGVLGEGSSIPSLKNCVVWGNEPDNLRVFYATAEVSWSNIEGGWPGDGNIDSDPLFADPAGGDYRLTAGSPCIDAGSNEAAVGVPTDLDGNLRLWDGDDVPGAVVDMGAYEFGSIAYVPGDTDRNGVVDGLDLFYFSLWWQFEENAANGLCDCVDDGIITEADLLWLIPRWR